MKPKLVIDNEVYRKVMHWVNKSQFEVSGLGTIIKEKDGTLRVNSVMLLPQKNQATHTEIEPNAVCKAMYELRDAEGELRWWWHSHVQMGCFWSKTDMDTIKEWGDNGWVAATVFNQKREYRSAIHIGNSDVGEIFLDQVETAFGAFVEPMSAVWDAEYDKNVTNTTWTPSTQSQFNYQGERYLGNGHGGLARLTTPSATSGVITSKLSAVPDDLYEKALKAFHASERPKGMTKREWKAIRKAGPRPVISLINPLEVKSGEIVEDLFDEYGFNQDERNILVLANWTPMAIVRAVEEDDFSPEELLDMADCGIEPHHVQNLLKEGWSAGQIMQTVEHNLVATDRGREEDADVPFEDLSDVPEAREH